MKQEPKFEELIAELEKIVGELDGSIGLEESLKKFERGMQLAKEAEARLSVIENQFQKIQQQFIPVPEDKPTDKPDSEALPF